MRSRLVLVSLALVLLAGACGGGDGDDSTAAGETTLLGEEGDSDCAAVREAAGGLGLALQILAQLRTPQQYALVKDGTLALDPAATLADLEVLRGLEGAEVPAGYDNVAEVLDTYEKAAALAEENLAVDDPFADAKGDELVALTEDVPAFLKGQVTIGFALDAEGCS